MSTQSKSVHAGDSKQWVNWADSWIGRILFDPDGVLYNSVTSLTEQSKRLLHHNPYAVLIALGMTRY